MATTRSFSVFLLLAAILGLSFIDHAHALSSCLDNTDNEHASFLKTVPCTTSCLATYDVAKKTTIQTCAEKKLCSIDNLLVENVEQLNIGEIKHCCVSQDNCNTNNLAHRVYMPLPFSLSSCFQNQDKSKSEYTECSTSCEVTYNNLAKTLVQQCSPPESACKKDSITFDSSDDSVKFCCVGSNNCNLVDMSRFDPKTESAENDTQEFQVVESLNKKIKKIKKRPSFKKPIHSDAEWLEVQKVYQRTLEKQVAQLKQIHAQNQTTTKQRAQQKATSKKPSKKEKVGQLAAFLFQGKDVYKCQISNKNQTENNTLQFNLGTSVIKSPFDCVLTK